MNNKHYLNPREISKLLMVSVPTVRNWVLKGELRAIITPGGHRRFLKEDVKSFAMERGIDVSLLGEQISSTPKLRVLVIDDDTSVTFFLSELLSDTNYNCAVKTVNNSFDAGMTVREFEPDVVLLDIRMPGLNGVEACKALMAMPVSKRPRIIGMSGYLDATSRKEMTDAGASTCIEKPLTDISVLINAINNS